MIRYLKSSLMVIAGLCRMACAVLIGLFLCGYLVDGAGLQVFGFLLPISATTVSVGVVHFTGFAVAAGLCFVIGAGLLAYGVTPPPEQRRQKDCGDGMDGA